MLSSEYIEDIFVKFFDAVIHSSVSMQTQDSSAALSFYNCIQNGTQLTENQGRFILKILDKYKNISAINGYDYKELIKTPSWKSPFRVLDLTKKISVEKDAEGKLWICVKFPYNLKTQFDKEVFSGDSAQNNSYWDHERKYRRLPFYGANLMLLHDFCANNGFEIDESFIAALNETEEIWNRSNEVTPFSVDINNEIVLVNSNEDTENYWTDHKTDSKEHNMFLAKSMGYPLKLQATPKSLIEKISNSDYNNFWIKDFKSFFEMYKNIGGVVCVLIDRASSPLPYLQEFIEAADISNIDRADIKVCFREDNNSTSEFNKWVKEQSLGGKVDSGKIFIFNQKPPKWLFHKQIPVKLIVTNNLYPDTSMLVRDWLSGHPCVCYIGNIKPSIQRKTVIVEL